jgi:hypothetical protein
MAMSGFTDGTNPKAAINPTAPKYYQPYSSGGCAALEDDFSSPYGDLWWTNGFGIAQAENVESDNSVWKWLMNGLEELCIQQIICPPVENGADLLIASDDMIGFRDNSRHLAEKYAVQSRLQMGRYVVPGSSSLPCTISSCFRWNGD